MTKTAQTNGRGGIVRALESSFVFSLLRGVSSQLAGTAQWFVDATRQSVLFRWLRTDSDPAVIVIDLRATTTIGPIIAIIERLVTISSPAANSLDRAWRTSRLYRMGDWVAGLIEAAIDTRAGRAVAKLFEPPDPPEEG